MKRLACALLFAVVGSALCANLSYASASQTARALGHDPSLGQGLAVPTAAQAANQRTVVVLFTGLSGLDNPGGGMRVLQRRLEARFGGPQFSSAVFGHTQQSAAFDFIRSFQDLKCLILVGHSFGGDAVIELATDFLSPNGMRAALSIQVDAVGIGADVLPTNIDAGLNYFQTTDLQALVVRNVRGATNINATRLFNDRSIIHTSIDDDPRLHNLIVDHVASTCDLPTCELTARTRTTLTVTVQDKGDGLRTVTPETVNMTVEIPPFDIGRREPLVVTAARVNPLDPARLTLTIVDVVGNMTVCDPVQTVLFRGRRNAQLITAIPGAEGVLTIANGTPGLRRLVVKVNGRRLRSIRLAWGEKRDVDVSRYMVPGDSNTVALRGYGPRGASAEVLIWDGLSREKPSRNGARPPA
jgi:hypothetical protein